jgi:hypothetical protein
MQIVRRPLRLALAVGALAFAGEAFAAHQLVRSVPRGKATVIAYNWWFTAGCVPAPRPRVNIVAPPSFGSIRVLNGAGVVNEANNACFGKRSNSVGLVYQPRPGFVGSDAFEVEWQFPDGSSRRSRYSFPVQ